MKWKIFYIDNTTFSNADGEPQDAPGGGVAFIAQQDDVVGVALHRGNDFYVFDQQYGGWYGTDHFDFTQYLIRPGLKIVKLGESMITADYMSMLKLIQDDPDLPKKSAHYEWETR